MCYRRFSYHGVTEDTEGGNRGSFGQVFATWYTGAVAFGKKGKGEMGKDRTAVVRGPYDGEYVAVAGDRYRYLATSEETDGQYALIEAVVPPGGGPPPHRHSREEEGFYVLEGTVTVYIEDQKHEATPGSFVQLPKGSKHWFHNHTKAHAKMLILVAPGGIERMFREVGQAIGSVHDTIPPFGASEKERLVAAAPKYGVEILPPATH